MPLSDSEPVNLFAQQASNRRRSALLMFVFVLFFTWLGFGGDWLAWQFTMGAPKGAYHHGFPWLGILLFGIGFGLVFYNKEDGARQSALVHGCDAPHGAGHP